MINKIEEIKFAIKHILKIHGVKRAAFFGSIVRNELTPESDIDLLIEFEGKKSLLDLVRLKLEIEDMTGKSVDILTYKSLHPDLKEKIISEQEVIL